MTPQALVAIVRSAATATVLVLALLVASLGGFGAAVAWAAPPTEPSALPPSAGTLMTQLVNADRAAFGLQPLDHDQQLADVALWRSEDMATGAYFSHNVGNVPGRLVFEVLRSQGVRYRAAGENLARMTGSAENTAATAQAALMASPTHRANILRPEYTHLGVGVAVAPDGRILYTQLFKTAW